jgi:transposase
MRLHVEEGLTYKQIAEKLGIRHAVRIKRWYSAYRKLGELAFAKKSGRPRKGQSDEETIKQLRMENALLKKFHTELRKVMLAKRDIGSSNTIGKITQ